jgi:hypothetical protein
MLRRVVELYSVQDTCCFLRNKGFIKSIRAVGVELVTNHGDGGGGVAPV